MSSNRESNTKFEFYDSKQITRYILQFLGSVWFQPFLDPIFEFLEPNKAGFRICDLTKLYFGTLFYFSRQFNFDLLWDRNSHFWVQIRAGSKIEIDDPLYSNVQTNLILPILGPNQGWMKNPMQYSKSASRAILFCCPIAALAGQREYKAERRNREARTSLNTFLWSLMRYSEV